MRILLLGATGRTGRLILDQAIERGHSVNCLVRDLDKISIKNENLALFEGSPAVITDLERAIQNCNVVISALNISRNSDFPWAKLRTPETFLSDVTGSLILLAKKHDIKRVIICSAWGVAETKTDLPNWFRWFIDHSNIGVTYEDHERQEELIRASNLLWTIVRPTGLTNSKMVQQILESYNNRPNPSLTISRQSVAKYFVDAIDNNELIHKCPVISRK